MKANAPIRLSEEVCEALESGQPVVALESTIIAHGMPYPENIATARALKDIIRGQGGVPAVVAVADGAIQVGCDDVMLERLATAKDVWKVSRRDMGIALAQRVLGATTVSGTLIGAQLAGIRVFVTGGIGGVHRGVAESWDISADLPELARAEVAVVSAGAKSILDLPKTLEALETAGVPVIGWGTEEFPAFFTPSSGLALVHATDDPAVVARAMDAQWSLGLGGGLLVANPVPEEAAADPIRIQAATEAGLRAATEQGISGKATTPFLLRYIKEATGGHSLEANRALVMNNARVGAAIARAYSDLHLG